MDLVELLARHTPCFFLPGERVDPYAVPTSFDQLLSMVCSVKCADSGRILRDGAITHEDVYSLLGDPAVELVRLQLSATARLGDRTVHIDDVPIYASVKQIRGDHEALELTYVTLFPYNGPYFGGIGAHDGDIEHITVRLNGDGELTGVWYNSHRSVDGMWVAASDVEFDRESGRIASYVAASGHGHYPQAGRWWRHFGLGNDICRRDVKWCPKTVIWIDSHAVSVPCRGPVCELAGGGERAVRVSPVDPARVDASGTRRHLADKKLRYWGQAAGLAHQPWFRETAESPRSRRWWMRVCTFFHLLDT